MIVVDASAAVAALLNAAAARHAVAFDRIHAPHLIDVEIANGLRRMVADGDLPADQGAIRLETWRRLAITRYPVAGLLRRIWALRQNLSAYDACYVALAEELGCSLLTCDARLARAPGVACPVTVVPG